MSKAAPASSVSHADQIKAALQQLNSVQQFFTPAAKQQMEQLLYNQGRGAVPGTNPFPGLNLKKQAAAAAAAAQLEENYVEEVESMGVAETYAEYIPTKLKLGGKHPDPVVETASLSSVPPPDVWYKVSICILNTVLKDAS